MGSDHDPDDMPPPPGTPPDDDSDADDEVLLKVGMKVMGLWPADAKDDDDEWFNGTVLTVDIANRTCHIKYDDTDEDDVVSWDHVRILEDLDG